MRLYKIELLGTTPKTINDGFYYMLYGGVLLSKGVVIKRKKIGYWKNYHLSTRLLNEKYFFIL